MTVSAGNSQVTVSWAAVSGATSSQSAGVTGACDRNVGSRDRVDFIQRLSLDHEGAQGTSIGSTSTLSFADNTAVNGTAYYYQVTAVNSAGESTMSVEAATNAFTRRTNVKMGGGGYVPGVI